MGKPVPLEDLPPELRARVGFDSAAFKDYAARMEAQHKLPEGTLTQGTYQMSANTDPLKLVESIIRDAGKTPTKAAPAPAAPKDVPSMAERIPGMVPFGRQTPAYDPTTNFEVLGRPVPDWLGQGAAGFGKSFADTGRGVGQMTGTVPQSEVDEAARADAPLMRTGPGTAGYVLGAVAQALPLTKGLAAAAPLAARVLPAWLAPAVGPAAQAVGTGAAVGALQPVETGGSRAFNAGMGGLGAGAGHGAAAGAQTLFRPAFEATSPLRAQLAQFADRKGIPLTAAQISDSPFGQAASGFLNLMPFTGGKKLAEDQEKAFTRALARSMGEDTDDALAAVRNAGPRIGGQYDALKARNNLQLEPWHVDGMLDAAKNVRAKDVSTGKADSNQMDELVRMIVNSTDNNGVIPGAVYKELRSKIGSIESKAADTDYQKGLGELKGILDKAFKSTLSKGDAKALAEADRQWANYKTLLSVTPKDASGNFDFRALASQMNAKSLGNRSQRNALVLGRGDQELPTLARLGVEFLGKGAPAAGPSGAARVKEGLKMGARFGAAPVIGGGLYSLNSKAETEDPAATTLKELGAILGAGLVGGRAVNSRWFARGVPAGVKFGRRLGELQQAPTGYADALMHSAPEEPPGYKDGGALGCLCGR